MLATLRRQAHKIKRLLGDYPASRPESTIHLARLGFVLDPQNPLRRAEPNSALLVAWPLDPGGPG
jgi:hypothetical protein